MVNQLLEHGAAVDGRASGGRTALMQAAAAGHSKVAQRLIAMGANRRMRDLRGNSALDLAEQAGHEDIRTLLKASAGGGWFR